MTDALISGLLLVMALTAICWDRYRLYVARYELDTMHRATRRDPLTGLANRAGMTDAWPMLAPCGPWVAVVDLDGFKPVNDTHGHAAGDVVLSTIGARLRQVPGTAARLGGDEFAALLPVAHPETIARRLAAAIAAPITLPTGAVVSVTASIGLARARRGDLHAALADADAAMYGPRPRGPVSPSSTPPATTTRPPTPARSSGSATWPRWSLGR